MIVNLKAFYKSIKKAPIKKLDTSLDFINELSSGKAEDMQLDEFRKFLKGCEDKVSYFYMQDRVNAIDISHESSPGYYGRRIL